MNEFEINSMISANPSGDFPEIDSGAFVDQTARIIGNVHIAAGCYIGPYAVIRADEVAANGKVAPVRIGQDTNIQDGVIIHALAGTEVTIGRRCSIAHGAIIHGAQIGRNVLVGMNAVLMDDAVIGAESIIGAMSFVKAETIIPKRSMVVGNPAKIIKEVSDEMISWKTKGTRLYQQLPADCHESLAEVEPLTEVPERLKMQESFYDTLREFMKH